MSKSRGNNSNTLLLIGGGFAAWYLFSRIRTISGLQFVPRGLAVVAGAVSLILGVQNPNSNGLYLNSLAGSLIINGNALGNVASFQPVFIAPNAETPVNIMVTPNLFGLAGSLLDLLRGNETGGISAVLQGVANINNNAIPVSLPFLT